MTGFQLFLKNASFLKKSHLTFKDVLVKHSFRANHILSNGLLPLKNKSYIEKLKIINNTNLPYAYRLSSSSSQENDRLESNELKFAVEPPKVNGPDDEKITDPAQLPANLNKDDIITESMLPPMPEDLISDVNTDILNTALEGEQTLTNLGLCSWWPSGRIQKILEILHTDFNLPWWESVAVVAFSFRLLTLPLNIIQKKRSNHFMNHMPQIQEFQRRIKEANISGNYFEAAKAFVESKEYSQKNNLQIRKQFYPMIIQSVIFISTYWALKKMANLPVESLKTSEFWWITDLTVSDPYYILPVIVSKTIYLILRSGVESNLAATENRVVSRLLIIVIPLAIFPFVIFAPSVIQIYWAFSNFSILLFTLLLKIPGVKKFLKIPDIIKKSGADTSVDKKKLSLLKEIKMNLNNYKVQRAIMERERLSALNFEKAGNAPTLRTFKSDPTKKISTEK